MDIAGLNVKNFTLEDLNSQDWMFTTEKYPLYRNKPDNYIVPFCVGHITPIVISGDDHGNVFCWKHTDNVGSVILQNCHIHSSPIDSIAVALDDQHLFSLSSADSMICQWEIKTTVYSNSTNIEENLDIEEEYKNGKYSENILREMKYSYAYTDILSANKNEMKDCSVLIKGSKTKLLNHVLATENYKEYENIITKPPIGIITLQHIYGMQCGFKRQTLKYYHENKDNKKKKIEQQMENIPVHKGCSKWISYFVSRYVILQDIENNKQWIYEGHKSKVTCYALHPFEELIASAGEGNIIHIHNCSTRDYIKVLRTSHETGISCIEFSADGQFLLSMGSGKQSLHLFNWEQEREIAFRHLSEAIFFDIRFSPIDRNHIFAIGNEVILELELRAGLLIVTNVVWTQSDQPGNSMMLCMDFLIYSLVNPACDVDIYIGTSGGHIGILSSHQYERLTVYPAHTGAINCIKVTRLLYSPVCIITAGDDNLVKLWDLGINTIGLINVCSLDIYKNPSSNVNNESGLQTSYFCGIHSLDLYMCNDKVPFFLIGLRNGDVLELEISVSNKEEEEGESKQDSALGRVHAVKLFNECKFLKRAHSSLGLEEDERRLCVAVYPQSPPAILASAGYDSSIRFWNISNDTLLFMEDLGKDSGMKVSALAFSPDGEYLLIGLFTGQVIYYKFSLAEDRNESGIEANILPNIEMKSSTHDSLGSVLSIKFSYDGEILGVSYHIPQKELLPSDIQYDKSMTYVVIIYNKTPERERIARKTKEIYTKVYEINLPVAPGNLLIKKQGEHMENAMMERSVAKMEFSKCNRFLQLFIFQLVKEGKRYIHMSLCTLYGI